MAEKQFLCIVMDEDGIVWTSPSASRFPSTMRWYPEDFAGALALKDGRYEVMWFEQCKWLRRPLIRYIVAASIGR